MTDGMAAAGRVGLTEPLVLGSILLVAGLSILLAFGLDYAPRGFGGTMDCCMVSAFIATAIAVLVYLYFALRRSRVP